MMDHVRAVDCVDGGHPVFFFPFCQSPFPFCAYDDKAQQGMDLPIIQTQRKILIQHVLRLERARERVMGSAGLLPRGGQACAAAAGGEQHAGLCELGALGAVVGAGAVWGAALVLGEGKGYREGLGTGGAVAALLGGWWFGVVGVFWVC